MQELDNRLLHIYITDSLKAICDNTSVITVPGAGVMEGVKITKRWFDLVHPVEEKPEKSEDNRSCREITDGIWARMRGGRQ